MNPSSTDPLVIGYGTLLYRPSIEHTLGGDPRRPRRLIPVRVHELRRLFNLRPHHYRASNRFGRPGIEDGAMNVEPAATASLTGVAFRVSAAELESLDRREHSYERIEAAIRHFDSGENLGTAQIYCSPPDADWIERDPTRLLPLWRDLVWARVGAYGISRRFGEGFDQTTYLADGKTLVARRYRGHLTPGEPPSPDSVSALSERSG